MKFAIWTAVSTKAQANDDRESLPNQEKTCRATAREKGWTETAGPFVAAGKSRTRWVNLRDAELEIPALHEMLESARQRQFDILTLYDHNRLRDLLDPVAKTLESYGIQIYSCNQPVEPHAPGEFSPYSSDSGFIVRGMSHITSQWQIADLRRKAREGAIGRVRKGLHGNAIPWGYRKSSKKDHAAEIVPDQAQVVIAIKDMFLAGISIREMQDRLRAQHCPTPKDGKQWERAGLAYILKNPFYAGKTMYGRFKTISDPYHNTRHVQSQSPLVVSEGKHEPLYSWEEYQAILAEFDRRSSLPTMNRYTFSGLLVCSVCGKRLYHRRETPLHGNDKPYMLWRCDYPRNGGGVDHIGLLHTEAYEIIPPAIQKAVEENQKAPAPRMAQTSLDQDALNELQRQVRRVQHMTEREIYTFDEAETKIKELRKQIAALKDMERQQQRQEAEYRQWVSVVQEIQHAHLPQWIREEKSAIVNPLLLRLCREIVITPDRRVEVHFRF